MTNTEKTLLLAFIDNLIAQAQALRGAVSVLGREMPAPVAMRVPENAGVSDDEFADRFNRMLAKVKVGNDDGEETPDA